jgi:hypothetical protein
MTAKTDYVRKWSGIIGVTLTDSETGIIRALRLPTNAVIEDNPDVQKITGTDSLGRETNIGNNITAFKPVLTLSYSGVNLDLYAMSRGRKVVTQAFDSLSMPKEMYVRKSSYAAVPSGRVGFGVLEDVEVKASTLGATLETIELIQQPFDTFDAAELNSFAIGANFERKFSTDLVERQSFVQLLLPFATATTARYVSEDSLPSQAVSILAKSTNDTVTLVDVPIADIDPSGSKFDPKAETIELKFDLSGLGVCEPYSVYELAQKIYCDR